MSNGNAFHGFGAAQVKEQSPSVALDLKRWQLGKRLSLEFLRLYLDGNHGQMIFNNLKKLTRVQREQ